MATMTMSDADALLSATASPTTNTGPVLSATLATATPVYPTPGGAIYTLNTEQPAQVNVATVDTAPPAASGVDLKGLLWVGAGIDTAWLLSRSDRTVSGKKQNWLVPAIILAAGAGWYFFGDKIAAATATTPSGGGTSATDTQRQGLLQWGTGNAKVLAVINSADAATIDTWSRLVGMWNRGASTQELYSTYPNGTTGASWDKSIGKWWENFKLTNGI